MNTTQKQTTNLSKNGQMRTQNLITLKTEAKQKRKETLNYKSGSERLSEFFRSFDFYGESVQLTYHGDQAFKTLAGATMSILLTCLLALYGTNLFRVLVLKSQTDVSTGKQLLDLDLEDPFVPQELGFDFAFSIKSELNRSIGYFTARKFEYVYTDEQNEDGSYIRVINRVDMPYEACGDKHFKFEDQESIEMYGIDSFYCFTDKNYSLAGDYYANYFSFVEVAVWKCNNDTYNNLCKPKEEIDTFFNGRTFNFAFVNSIFSMNNYDNPINYYIDDSLYFFMESDRLKSADMFVMRSDLQLEDSLIQFGQEVNVPYYQVQNVRYYDNYVNQRQKIIEVYLRFDKHYELTQRQVYGLLQLLGDIGGLQSILYIFGFLTVAFFQKRMFISAIIKDVYQVRQNYNKSKPQKQNSRHQSSSSNKKVRKFQLSNSFEKGEDRSQRNLKQSASLDKTEREGILRVKELDSRRQKSFHTSNQDEVINPPKKTNTANFQKQMSLMDPGMMTPAERDQKINEKLKTVEELKLNNINMITREIITRKRFWYHSSHIFQYLAHCLCCRNIDKIKYLQKYKKHFYYKKGESKLHKELDVINLVRAIRNMKLVSQVILSQRHRMLLRFQRQHLIETDTTSQSDSDEDQYDTLKLMENKNPMIRLMIYGKIKRMMVWFLGQKLEKEDKNLIRGLFRKKLKDFDEDYKERNGNKSLMQRLKNELIRFPSKDTLQSSILESQNGSSQLAIQHQDLSRPELPIVSNSNLSRDLEDHAHKQKPPDYISMDTFLRQRQQVNPTVKAKKLKKKEFLEGEELEGRKQNQRKKMKKGKKRNEMQQSMWLFLGEGRGNQEQQN